MSSASWTSPRPKNHDQTRLTAARANQRFFGSTSQSANTRRGSSSAATRTAVPSGRNVSSASVGAGSRRTISSFHSPVFFQATREKKSDVVTRRASGHFSKRSPMNVSATADASASGERPWTARQKFTCGTRKLLPDAVSNSRANLSYGMFVRTASRIQRWYACTAFGQRSIGNSDFTRSTSHHFSAQRSANSSRRKSDSISAARLPGRRSSANARTSDASGSVPMTSMNARRRNVSSEHGSAGATPCRRCAATTI